MHYFHCLFISRKKYPLDGSDDEVIVADVNHTMGIAIDIEGDHLYWLDNGNGKIFRSDLDGSNTKEILTDLTNPRAIALDTVNKYLCYYYIPMHEFEFKCLFLNFHEYLKFIFQLSKTIIN